MKLDPPIKQLLVDLDGTLLGNRALPLSLDFVRRALARMRKYGGWRKSISTLIAINREFRIPHKELTNDIRVTRLFSERMNVGLEEGRQILRDGVSMIFPSLKKHFYPVPGSRDFLLWAKERYPLFLATNPVWPIEIVEMRLKWADIEPEWFASMTHIRKMHACKPEREYYLEILDELGLKPEECLLIGDDVKMDLPATRVGIRVFIVGEHKKLTSIKTRGSKAPAWRGSYAHLRQLLDD